MSASSARNVWDEDRVGLGPRQLNHGGGHATLSAADSAITTCCPPLAGIVVVVAEVVGTDC